MEKPDLGAPDIRHHYLKVTNRGDTDYTDRHDGVPITIKRGDSQNLPLDIAAHMFGYGYGVADDVMFRHACKRQGWNTPAHLKLGEDGKTLAQTLWSNLVLSPVIYKMVEEKPDLDAPIPADPGPPVSPPPSGYAGRGPVSDEVDNIPPLPKRHKGAA